MHSLRGRETDGGKNKYPPKSVFIAKKGGMAPAAMGAGGRMKRAQGISRARQEEADQTPVVGSGWAYVTQGFRGARIEWEDPSPQAPRNDSFPASTC